MLIEPNYLKDAKWEPFLLIDYDYNENLNEKINKMEQSLDVTSIAILGL